MLRALSLLRKLTAAVAASAALSCAAAAGCAGAPETPPQAARPVPPTRPSGGLDRIQNVVVIVLENRSFDHLFGQHPGANGLAQAASAPPQVDEQGRPYAALPRPVDTAQKPPAPDLRFPADLPNAPFDIARHVPLREPTQDLVHRFYQQQAQINGGRMDRFASVSDAKGLAMGYYRTADLPLAEEAKRYTLCDNFFHAAFGGSYLNHIWLVAAATPVFPDAPGEAVAQLGPSGELLRDGAVTPDGYAVNTIYSVHSPHPPAAPPHARLPSQTLPTIGDRLSDAGVSWAWYAGGWSDAVAGRASPSYQFHHQPFVYFARYAEGTRDRAEHMKDEQAFFADAAAGRLPAVSFVKPLGAASEHPGYSDVLSGEHHALRLIEAVRGGPQWARSVIIVTYDENGGFWDHVPPPVVDRWGPGARVPTLVISPFARRGFVDHTQYDTTSILKLIEKRWKLAPLSRRDAAANDLGPALSL